VDRFAHTPFALDIMMIAKVQRVQEIRTVLLRGIGGDLEYKI
jgi:hypothetical protein